MSITSQQLNSWTLSENIESISIDKLPTFDFSSLTTQSIAALTTADISTLSWSSYNIPTMGSLTTADIITITGGGSGGSGGSTYVVGGSGGSGGYTYGSASTSYIWKSPEEWVETFPNFTRVQDMCKKYPALKIAYDKLVTTYKMVKDDYDNPENKK